MDAGDIEVEGGGGALVIEGAAVVDLTAWKGPEINLAVGAFLVIDPHVRQEGLVVAGEVEDDGRGGVAAEALGVGDAVEGNGFAVAGGGTAIAGVALDGPPAAGRGYPREIAEIGGGEGRGGGGIRIGRVPPALEARHGRDRSRREQARCRRGQCR